MLRRSPACAAFPADESGATAIEYALIAAGIGATIAARSIDWPPSRPVWDKIANAMSARGCIPSANRLTSSPTNIDGGAWTQTPSWSARASRACRGRRTRRCGPARHHPRSGAGGSLGGQAFWSFGGLFFVDSPEQRRLRIRDSRDLALQDWLGSAGFDRDEDHWPRRWAEAYVDFAAGEKRAWLRQQGLRIFPIVGWAERGGYLATGHGNSVPRFHVTWGTGPGVIEPFVRRVREAEQRGLVTFRFRHRVTALTQDRRRGRRRAGRRAGAEQCGARYRKFAPARRLVRAARAGDHRHLRRHRGTVRPRSAYLRAAEFVAGWLLDWRPTNPTRYPT